jgi:hypothetical protein
MAVNMTRIIEEQHKMCRGGGLAFVDFFTRVAATCLFRQVIA